MERVWIWPQSVEMSKEEELFLGGFQDASSLKSLCDLSRPLSFSTEISDEEFKKLNLLLMLFHCQFGWESGRGFESLTVACTN